MRMLNTGGRSTTQVQFTIKYPNAKLGPPSLINELEGHHQWKVNMPRKMDIKDFRTTDYLSTKGQASFDRYKENLFNKQSSKKVI